METVNDVISIAAWLWVRSSEGQSPCLPSVSAASTTGSNDRLPQATAVVPPGLRALTCAQTPRSPPFPPLQGSQRGLPINISNHVSCSAEHPQWCCGDENEILIVTVREIACSPADLGDTPLSTSLRLSEEVRKGKKVGILPSELPSKDEAERRKY